MELLPWHTHTHTHFILSGAAFDQGAPAIRAGGSFSAGAGVLTTCTAISTRDLHVTPSAWLMPWHMAARHGTVLQQPDLDNALGLRTGSWGLHGHFNTHSWGQRQDGWTVAKGHKDHKIGGRRGMPPAVAVSW